MILICIEDFIELMITHFDFKQLKQISCSEIVHSTVSLQSIVKNL
jgi:hypothetical protein